MDVVIDALQNLALSHSTAIYGRNLEPAKPRVYHISQTWHVSLEGKMGFLDLLGEIRTETHDLSGPLRRIPSVAGAVPINVPP